jgi:arylsulfatase A-like enzyme
MNVRNKIMFCATLLCGIATVTVGATEQRPNIIFLLTDDQSAGTLGCEGNLVIQTPNIDRLAANGVRFSDAHVVNPVCAPSRANYLTGQYVGVNGSGFPHAFGTISNEQWEKSYPALLRNNGYWTGFIGKFGVEYHEFKWREQEKFDFWYAHNQWARFHIKQQNREHTRIYKDAKSGLLPEVIGEGIERFLKEAPKDKPFCLSVSFNSPHNSMTGSMAFELEGHKFGTDTYTAPANRMPQLKDHPIYGSLYRDKHLDFMFAKELGQDPYQYIPREVLDQEAGRTKLYHYAYDKEKAREHMVRYFQCITGIDAVVGRMVAQLEKLGVADHTIIAFASDHGLSFGHHGMGGKELLYDQVTRVPFIVYDPRLPKNLRGRVIDKPVLNVDLAPTVVDYAGLEIPGCMQGKSLVPLLTGTAGNWRDEIFLESMFALRGNPVHYAVRTDQFKYIRFFNGDPWVNYKEGSEPPDKVKKKKGRNPKVQNAKDNKLGVYDFRGIDADFEMLFAIDKDSGERVNLAANPEYADELAKMRSKCDAYIAGQVEQRQAFVGSLKQGILPRYVQAKIAGEREKELQ